MTPQPGKQAVATHILHNISRSKDNQTMKFGQLIKCSIRNIFSENYVENLLKKLFLEPKNS